MIAILAALTLIASAIIFILIFASIENYESFEITGETFAARAIAFIVACLFIWFGTTFSEFWISKQISHIIGILPFYLGWAYVFLLYVFSGIVFSTFRWIHHVSKASAWMNENFKIDWRPVRGFGDDKAIVETDTKLWGAYGGIQVDVDDKGKMTSPRSVLAPKAKNFKWAIMSWAAFWPYYFVSFMIKDSLRMFWNAIFNMISGVFDAISKAIFK